MKRIRRKWKGQFKHRKNMKRYGLGRKGEGQGKKLKNKRPAVRDIFILLYMLKWIIHIVAVFQFQAPPIACIYVP